MIDYMNDEMPDYGDFDYEIERDALEPDSDGELARTMQDLSDKVNEGKIRLFTDADMMESGQRIKNASLSVADSMKALRLALEAEYDKGYSAPALSKLREAAGLMKQVNSLSLPIMQRDGVMK